MLNLRSKTLVECNWRIGLVIFRNNLNDFFGFLPWSHCGCRFTQGSLDGVVATMVDLGRVKVKSSVGQVGIF